MLTLGNRFELGDNHAIRFYSDGEAVWWHPGCHWHYLDLTSGLHHHVVSGDADHLGDLTIDGEIHCPTGTDDHGRIAHGEWVATR